MRKINAVFLNISNLFPYIPNKITGNSIYQSIL